MATLLEYSKVDEEFRAWLSTHTEKQIGLCRIPAKDEARDELAPEIELKTPYAVIYPLTSPRATGSWAQPEEDRELVYQITCVGEDPRQVRWMSDKVRDIIVACGPNGYIIPFSLTTAPGKDILCRYGDAVGAILPAGVDLYNIHDIYRLQAGV